MKKLLCAFVFSVFAMSAFAQNLWIEPFVGYSLMGKATMDVGGEYEWTYGAPVFGGRLGINMKGILAGFQYDVSSFDLEADNSLAESVGNYNDMTAKNMGIYVGYQLPVMLKVWGTYYFNSKMTQDGSSEDIDGTGFSVGLGFKPFPLPIPKMDLYVNAEYRSITWDFDGDDFKDKQVLLSVSLPITL